MKKVLLPLFCLLIIHCGKSKNDSQHEVKADLVEVLADDVVEASKEEAPPPPREMEPVNDKTVSSAVASAEDVEPETGKPTRNTTAISKKVIKNGNMSIQVSDIKKAQNQVNSILKKNKAYIQKENFSNTDVDENLDFTIRVPHQNFDALINTFSDGVGSVLSKNISSDDVTEEYTDISIKLANKKIYLEKYRDMLKSAKTTKDMLEIQENIRALEDEIDVSEGRLRFIDDRVDYSTLNLSLHKEKVRSSETSKIGFGSRFGDSLTEGWNSFVTFLLGIIALWPFFLLIPVVILVWKRLLCKRKNK
ncbi:DUF4349 domain-containing protein [Chryseobacterium sp. SSA4.19]|uniref:DUF4349 domain-containing protein n=1 Tax=Chryseobacterium sp. SSA4.19 TaxID=2919915 RepID=UPI001F4D616C|nr:DUF4349 domain-containing protein [Chryseobacterium sp. SSA4.19]MCJ8153888.1 DUF4349 domain-containing protein [Chryseobacterium sp. SSA4.19]